MNQYVCMQCVHGVVILYPCSQSDAFIRCGCVVGWWGCTLFHVFISKLCYEG